MTTKSFAKLAGAGAIVTLVAIVLAAMSIKAPRVRANDDDDESRIQIGFKIAPVLLNLQSRDRAKVGLGSYLVNAVGDCNGCHSSGSAPLGIYPYVTGYNPYFNQPEKIDPTVYLNGGPTSVRSGLQPGLTGMEVHSSSPEI
ncbi:MAG TPA: hypothetical protein VI756_06485 [Blastocatellia bacterium]